MTTTEATTRTHSHDDDPNSLPAHREHSLDAGEHSLTAPTGSLGLAGLVLLDVDALVPDRRNQRRPLDAELVASVAAHGVLEPVLVIAEPEQPGMFQIVAGERRWRAARKAGLATVPAIVRSLSIAEIAEIQLVENLARTDLSATQAAAAMARCIEVGMSVKDLAARIGRSSRWVTVRLRLLELPPAGRRLVDDGTWSLDDATAAAKLLDHPEQLAELMDSDPRDVDRAVRVALDRIERQRRADALAARAEAAGWSVVDDEGYSPRSYRPLVGAGGLGLDAAAHAGEPCHAVVIPARSPELVAVCTDARRHASRGPSAVKAAGGEADGDKAVERERRAAKRAADEQRRAFLDQLLAARVRKADAVGLICWSLLAEANTAQASAACGLLGLDADQGPYAADWHSPLRRLAADSEAGLVRAALAVGLAQGDEAVRQGVTWHGRVDRFEAWLAAQGYEPSPYEVDQAAARHQRQGAEGD